MTVYKFGLKSLTVKVGSLLGVLIVINSLWFTSVAAQISPFLITPYYGGKTITQNYSGAHPAIDLGLNYDDVLAAASGTVDTVSWWNNNCHNSATWPIDDNNCGFGLHARIDYGN
jgi:hypothetical protein